MCVRKSVRVREREREREKERESEFVREMPLLLMFAAMVNGSKREQHQ